MDPTKWQSCWWNNLMNSSGSSISGCKELSSEAKNALGKCCMLSLIYHSTIYHASPFPWMTSPSSNISTNIWKKLEKHMACSTSVTNCFSRKHACLFIYLPSQCLALITATKCHCCAIWKQR